MPIPRPRLGQVERTSASRSRGCSRPLRARARRVDGLSRIAVVTGGSGGIGAAVVSELRSGGWEVISLSRREGCDVSDESQVKAAFGRMKTLDALVHCAALLIKKPLAAMTLVDWEAQLGAGLRGAFLCSREAFRLMAERGGSIVMVSSLSGVAGAEKFPGMSAYVAAKSGLAGLTEALAVEGRSLGVRVNAVSPGAVDTAMLRVAGVEGPSLAPAEVARIIVWLASSESEPISGANIRIDPPGVTSDGKRSC
ncbi:MAG: SDR family oxidoreductase [Chloroflexi bacterium]|nr:MAG: SDR family oxidoreductase [Chloroflexota bacterium]